MLVTDRIPQGSILRLVLFNIIISCSGDVAINCSEDFAGDTKPGEDQLTCSMTRLPFRDLDRLEDWQELAFLKLVF